MSPFDHFNILAPIYDRVISTRVPERIISLAGLPVPGKLLDAGGGTGRIAQGLIGKASHVIVCDLSLEMLKRSKEKPGLVAVNSHTECLPFASNCFDTVIMVDALHHVIDQAQTASELLRVLKPGGRMVIEEPDIRTVAVKFIALAEKITLMRSHFLSPNKIAGLFKLHQAQTHIEWDGASAWVTITKKITG